MHSDSKDKTTRFHPRKLGGYAYTLADGLMFGHGAADYHTGIDKAGGKGRMLTGAGWGVGGYLFGRYGAQPIEKQQERLTNKLAAFMEKQGVTLDGEQTKQATAHKKRSLWKKIEHFIYDYPTQVLNTYYGVMATGLLMSGFSKYKKQIDEQGRKVEWRKMPGDIGRGFINPNANVKGAGDLSSGILVILGAIVAIFVKEKSPRKLKNASALDKFLHTKPLAFASALYMLNNWGTYLMAKQEMTEAKDPSHAAHGKKYRSWLRYGILGLYITGNLLVGSGSKKAAGTSEEHEAGIDALLEKASKMIAAQPEEQQAELAEATANYFAKQNELRLKDQDPKELEARLMEKVAQVKEGAPAAPRAMADETPQPSAAKDVAPAISEKPMQTSPKTDYRTRVREEANLPQMAALA